LIRSSRRMGSGSPEGIGGTALASRREGEGRRRGSSKGCCEASMYEAFPIDLLQYMRCNAALWNLVTSSSSLGVSASAFCFLLIARSSLDFALRSSKHANMDASAATPPPSLQTLSLASPAPSPPPSPPPRPPPAAETIRYERYAGEQVSSSELQEIYWCSADFCCRAGHPQDHGPRRYGAVGAL